MSDRRLPDLSNSIEWNLVARESHQVTNVTEKSYNPIPARTYLIENSWVVQVGIKSNNAGQRWKTGGWATMLITALPSTTSEFVATTRVTQRWIQLGTLSLLVFPKMATNWILEVSFPWWFENALIEIWRYDGIDQDGFYEFDLIKTDLQRIEGKIDSL